MDKLTIIKIGGKVVDNPPELDEVLRAVAGLSGRKILVHGGGSLASRMEEAMGLVPTMVDGRRVTGKESLDIVTMVYAGLINKNIVAALQSYGANGLGLSGADGNVILAHKRAVGDIDYGFVGDVESIDAERLNNFLDLGLVPVISAITHDGNGQLLNTNADTMAAEIAGAMAQTNEVELILAFEKAGVLDASGEIIQEIDQALFQKLLTDKVIVEGMIPKLTNAFAAINNGVKSVKLASSGYLVKKEVHFTNVVHHD